MDIDKIFYEFRDKYPTYASGIVSYSEDKWNSIKFTFSDGHTALYFPVDCPVEKKIYKKRKK